HVVANHYRLTNPSGQNQHSLSGQKGGSDGSLAAPEGTPGSLKPGALELAEKAVPLPEVGAREWNRQGAAGERLISPLIALYEPEKGHQHHPRQSDAAEQAPSRARIRALF